VRSCPLYLAVVRRKRRKGRQRPRWPFAIFTGHCLGRRARKTLPPARTKVHTQTGIGAFRALTASPATPPRMALSGS